MWRLSSTRRQTIPAFLEPVNGPRASKRSKYGYSLFPVRKGAHTVRNSRPRGKRHPLEVLQPPSCIAHCSARLSLKSWASRSAFRRVLQPLRAHEPRKAFR
jgi:hypothetical protein